MVTDTRSCAQCGVGFSPRREHARFCSARCRVAWNRLNASGPTAVGDALDWTITAMRETIDRVLRAGHYWVPMWNKSNHLVAYWDLFGRPAQTPKYGLNEIATWWYDEAKAKKTDLSTH